MRCVSGPKLWLMAMALAGGSLPCAGEPREAGSRAGPPTAVARSALAILEAAAAPAGVTLRLRRAADQTPLPATGVTVSVAGRNAPATASADGSWFAPLPTAVGAGDTLEVVVDSNYSYRWSVHEHGKHGIRVRTVWIEPGGSSVSPPP